jgi:hypothetical protein
MVKVYRINEDWTIPFWASGNQFSGMTWAEYSSQVLTPDLNTYRGPPAGANAYYANNAGGNRRGLKQTTPPAAVNWITKGKVTAVRNQGSCCRWHVERALGPFLLVDADLP